MNLLTEVQYFVSIKKNEKVIRSLLRKNPQWIKGHMLLSELSNDAEVKELSDKAINLIKKL